MAKSGSSTNDSPKRTSPLRLVFIGIALFIFLSIALQTCGINIFTTTTSEEKLIDKPHSPERQERDVPEDLEIE
ncbi:MAG: hypothetical protein IPJ74_14190 [Saprospiraceae bacterium]|nr:hypothetical protein [Saprospiraceae bacterium]